MTYLSCLDNGTDPLVLDTSVLINLNATRIPGKILSSLERRILIPQLVMGEINSDNLYRRQNNIAMSDYLQTEAIAITNLDDVGSMHFGSLVAGEDTLDDGEASVIATAFERGGIAVLDERRARRICSTRYPDVAQATTIDLLSCSVVAKKLERSVLAQATYDAMVGARMRVIDSQIPWVIDLIGRERAATCNSLPNSVRLKFSETV